METSTRLTLKFFGVLRKYGDNSKIEISISEGTTVGELKIKVSSILNELHTGQIDPGLINECAIATEDRVLLIDEVVPKANYLAVLPPVCGG